MHPGEVLFEEVLKPLGLNQNRLGLNIYVHPRRFNEIVLHMRRVAAETALRLARYFGASPQLGLGLQGDDDLDVAAGELGERLEREVQVRAKASQTIWPSLSAEIVDAGPDPARTCRGFVWPKTGLG